MNRYFKPAAMAALLSMASLVGFAKTDHLTGTEREVGHELRMLSRYTVFDNISYRVDGGKVTLFGQVTQPVVKGDAGSAVKHVEGVTSVDNEIEVLPLSPMDDQIRRAEYRAIYGDPALTNYSFEAVPPIHIIVKNGNVTLEGVVANQMDRDLAGLRAQAVGSVFSVKNNLRTDSGH